MTAVCFTTSKSNQVVCFYSDGDRPVVRAAVRQSFWARRSANPRSNKTVSLKITCFK
jgi:hypothetical protein